MRIAYLLLDPGIGVFGTKGASVHVQEMIRAMRAAEQRVTVFCTRIDSHVPADLAGLDVRHVPLPATDAAGRERAIGDAGRRIAAAVAAEGFDAVYERYSLFSTAGALLADSLPVVLEVNAPLIAEQSRHRTLVDADAALRATLRQFGAVRLVTCVSPDVARWAVDMGADPARVLVVPNGVNTDRFTPAVHSRRTARVQAGFVGTLKPWHGTDVLVRALGHAPGVELVVCGTGPERARLEGLAAGCGVADRVRFLGAVPPGDVPDVLAGLDIAVAPYPPGDHYFSPLKVYEYMAAGLPVVASAIGGLPDLLAGCGVLVPPGDEHALGTALAHLAADPGGRRSLGREGRRIAVARHDWRHRYRTVLDAFLEPAR
jgi:glycosyltransferase involved in cell wall biosynthesis